MFNKILRKMFSKVMKKGFLLFDISAGECQQGDASGNGGAETRITKCSTMEIGS